MATLAGAQAPLWVCVAGPPGCWACGPTWASATGHASRHVPPP